MPTTVTGKIGASNTPVTMDYSSLALWAAACPANLVTSDELYVGEIYNQGEMVISGQLTLSATTDATRYVILRAATGAGFQDHATASTNPLRYNPNVGAAIKGDQPYNTIASFSCGFDTSKLQWRNASTASPGVLECNSTLFKPHESIFASADSFRGGNIVRSSAGSLSSNVVFTNVLGIDEAQGANGKTVFGFDNGGKCQNCTAICVGGANGKGFSSNYRSLVLNNCAAFGMKAAQNFDVHSQSIAGANNGTDHATFDGTAGGGSTLSGSVVNVAYSTATFAAITGVTNGAGTGIDYRLVGGSALIDAGSSAGAPSIDILGVTRSAVDIGAHEYPLAALTATLSLTAANATISATAANAIAAALSNTAADATISATATSAIAASLSKTAAAATISATATSAISATLSLTTDDTIAATATDAITAVLSLTADNATISSASTNSYSGIGLYRSIRNDILGVFNPAWTHPDVPVYWRSDDFDPRPDPSEVATFLRAEIDFGRETITEFSGQRGANGKAQFGSVAFYSFTARAAADEDTALDILADAQAAFRSARVAGSYQTGAELSFIGKGGRSAIGPTEDGNWFVRGAIVVFEYRFRG